MSENGTKPHVLLPATCRFCHKVFRYQGVPIIGEEPDAPLKRFCGQLVNHVVKEHGLGTEGQVLQKTHPEVAEMQRAGIGAGVAMLLRASFATEDSAVRQFANIQRWRAKQMVQGVGLDDAAIGGMVDQILETQDKGDVRALLVSFAVSLRDILLEIGPNLPAGVQVVEVGQKV